MKNPNQLYLNFQNAMADLQAKMSFFNILEHNDTENIDIAIFEIHAAEKRLDLAIKALKENSKSKEESA